MRFYGDTLLELTALGEADCKRRSPQRATALPFLCGLHHQIEAATYYIADSLAPAPHSLPPLLPPALSSLPQNTAL